MWFNLKHYTLNRNPSNMVYKHDNVLGSNFILLHPPSKKWSTIASVPQGPQKVQCVLQRCAAKI